LDYQIELLIFFKLYQAHNFTELYPGDPVLGLPISYRYFAETLQADCTNKKVQVPKIEYFDSEGNLTFVNALLVVQQFDVKPNTPFDLMLNVACGAKAPNVGVGGRYEGMNDATYEKGGHGEQKNLGHCGASWERFEC